MKALRKTSTATASRVYGYDQWVYVAYNQVPCWEKMPPPILLYKWQCIYGGTDTCTFGQIDCRNYY